MKHINDIIRYPIKYLLKNKVKKYKIKLDEIEWRQKHLKPKSRRCGMTLTIFLKTLTDIRLKYKYEKFIRKWELK